jgi:PPOX class probable FMN-dependent enzyme
MTDEDTTDEDETDEHEIRDLESLRALYPEPNEAARLKVLRAVDKHARQFIARSPLLFLSTTGPGGGDCSPKGDPAGFVRILDDTTLAIPDRRGNNRIDTLENLVADPRIGLIFVIPGFKMTLRVNGRARISTDPALLDAMAERGKTPTAAILVDIEELYLHCAKAMIRSRVWEHTEWMDASEMPSPRRMLLEQMYETPDEALVAEAEADYDAHNERTLY